MKSVSPLTVFSLVQNFNWHLLKPVMPRWGEIRGQECNLFFLDRRFHWLIDWIFWVWGWGGGGGKEETASLKCEKRGRAFLWETLSNTPPRLDDRGREPCHSFCASVWLTSLERSCCFSFVLLVFRHVFTHRRKNLFLFDTLAFLWV